VVNGVRFTLARRSRVYTFQTACLLVLLVLVTGGAAAPAPPESGADPVMIKGPAGARVTIVEFSDYQ
jgi:hypothetical protein